MAVNSASGFRSLHPSVGQVASSGSRLPAAIELGDGGSDCCLEARCRQFYRIVFSSRKDNVNVIRLKANNKGKINVELSLEETPGREGEHFEHDLDHAFSEVNREASGHWLTYHAAYDKDPGGYDGVAKVTLRGGNIQTKGKSLVVRNAEEVLIIVSIVPQEDARNASLDAVKAGLDKLATNYDKLLRPHAQNTANYFTVCSWI